MLILVGVTIRVATDGKLFTHAANAAKGTRNAIAEENSILDGDIDGKSIDEIVTEQTTEDLPLTPLPLDPIGPFNPQQPMGY